MKKIALQFGKAMSAALFVLMMMATEPTKALAQTQGAHNRDYSDLPTFEYNGLTYVVAPDPQSNYSNYFSYSAANSYCENLTLYGYSDWRMPSITELEMMYQNRTSIGGFVEGTTYNVVCYHSSTYYNSSNGHYKLSWKNGQRMLNSVLENSGAAYIEYEGSMYYIYCHVRPIRIHIGVPTVTTNEVTTITTNYAACGGNVTNSGGAQITERGVCWSTSHNPTINDSRSIDAHPGTGSYTCGLVDLLPGTQYYVRAYAINSEGTAYGDEVSFTTDSYSVPTVTTNSVFDITTTSAKGGGYVSDNGNSSLTETGICWSTSHNPTTYNSNNHTSYPIMGSYTLNMTGLIPGTQYYVRAYATNSEGTAYGEEVSFITHSPPTVTTNSVTNITPNSAACGGNVTAEGSGSVTARGVCWSTSPTPTTSDNHTNNGTGTGNFTSNLTGLNQGTLYYVRAYATNSEGTAYGEEVSFTTICVPTVTTNNVTNINPTTATCGGNVTNNCSGAVTARGICWDTSHNPTTSNSHTNEGMGEGTFTSNITGLSHGTQYYVRAYATNSSGTCYGDEVSFTTTDLMVTTSDVTSITQTTAICGGYVTVYGGASVMVRGVCWSSSNQNPTVNDNSTTDGTGSGNFTSYILGLTQNTTYYVRSYVISNEGTVYGETKQFTTTKLEYLISEGGVVATSAGGFFYDSGGPDRYYGSNEQYTMTFTSNQGSGTMIQMTFTQFNTCDSNDYLMVYDGMNTSATLIGTYYGSNSPGTVTATNPDGALTFVFISDNTWCHPYAPGWKAAISIVGQSYSYTINTSANPSYGGTVSGGGYYNGGESCTITAQANDGYVFTNWTENGNVVSTNASYTFTVNSNRSLVANFVEVGGESCNIVFDLMDSYGDGWNGNKLNVAFSDGSPSQELTFSSGYNATYVIEVNDDVYVTLSWTQGGFISECSFKVRYEIGPQIYYGSNLNSSFTYSFQMDCSSSNNAITFADTIVKALCVANWDTNNDGELSYAEAAAVTDLGTVFKNNSSITYFNELQYFVGLTSIGNLAFYNCTNLTSIVIPNTVISIGSQSFMNCNNLTSFAFPYSVTTIGSKAFAHCIGLTSIIIPYSVNSIHVWAFDNCSGLEQIVVKAGNSVYDSRSYCNAIIKTSTNTLVKGCKNTVIPNSVTTIGNSAFYGCNNLTTIGIPNSVTTIEAYAFGNCYGLTSMTVLAETPPTIEVATFTGVNRYIPVYVPCESVGSYQSATSWSSFKDYHGIGCLYQVQAQYYPDVNDPYSEYVKVHWDNSLPISGYFESFETGDFNQFDWQVDPAYPWTVTTYQPYEGTFCMRSGGAGVANVVSSMTVTVDIPADGIMSFFGKISCENNWDYGYFYIDGIQKGYYTGAGNWEEKTFEITAGPHTFKWSYTKDSSTNSNDDCFYVDYITFFRNPEYFSCYRAQCNGNETTLVANDIIQNHYLDSDWQNLPPGMYKYGIQNQYGSSSDIVWSNCIEKHASYQITATANPTEGGTVTGFGSYDYGTTCTLSATPNQGYRFVNWTENNVEVSVDATYSFTVTVARTLVANFEEITLHWTPEQLGFEDYMALTSIIQIDGVEQHSNQLEVGAFCGEQCRGSQLAVYWGQVPQLNRYVVYLQVYGQAGESISFKLFDHSINQELELASPSPVAWTQNTTMYTEINPYVLNFTSQTVHSQTLPNGWNWWSTYVQLGTDGLSNLETSLGNNGDQIKSWQDGYVNRMEYQGYVFWSGSLSAIHNDQMYIIKTNQECTVEMTGLPVLLQNTPITINPGWNWIGFPSSQNLTVANAMAQFDPQPNDMIKGRNGYASFVTYGSYSFWSGQLSALEPGQGYKYYSNSSTAKTVTYSSGRGNAPEEMPEPAACSLTPVVDRFASNMTVTAVVDVEGVELRSGDYELAAFVGDECRGSVKLVYVEPLDRFLAFLLVFGEENENLRFALTDGRGLNWSVDRMVYTVDGMSGSPTEPVVLHFGPLGVDESIQNAVVVYPNPSKDVFNIEGNGIRKIEVVNAFGQIIQSKEVSNDFITIDLGSKACGAYLLRVITNDGVVTTKLIKNNN